MNDSFRMDGHKLFWHLDRVNEWQQGKRIVPLHIDFGISTGCNMACKYCYGMIQARTNKIRRYDMPKEAIIRFLDDAKECGVRSIAFVGEGENTLNPALVDVVEHAGNIDLDVSLATNGIEIPEGDDLYRLMSNLKWIRFNISAATPESFRKVHNVPRGTFHTVIKNIENCVAMKKKHNLDTTIGMQMVTLEQCYPDIVPLAQLGGVVGADYLVIKPCSDTPEGRLRSPQGDYINVEETFKEAEKFSTDDYKVIVKWSKMMNAGVKSYKTCHGTKFIIAISGNGNVFPCGHWFDVRKEEFLLGNIVDQSFKDIVKSKRYWEVQDTMHRVNVNHDCESNCRQHYINEFLYNISQPVQHQNFV